MKGDIAGSGSLVVGSSDGAATTLALESGTQSFGTLDTRPGAALAVNSRLQAQSPLLNGGTLGGDGTVSGMVVNKGTLSPGTRREF